ncbi:hypothetical protein DFQ27_003892 [Actinomortierella ambigua]|uniref:F-box domain-containing protein n=1 Tax=Actinomortierella ambigua TaxID=1343610 RepID=A0A9P6Q5G0_9FUNG|nr:hypothetical protein DFQ27_003892 [Actinomortierella ambigua]
MPEEPRVLLVRYLDTYDLKACALVNKAWHFDFQPFVWHTVSASFPEFRDPSYRNRIAWLNSIRNNAASIRHLTSLSWDARIDPDLYAVLIKCSHGLSSIRVGAKDEPEFSDMMDLIKANTRLQKVHVQAQRPTFFNPVDSKLLLTALTGHHRLSELTLAWSLTVVSALQLLEACPSLKSLCIVNLDFSPTPTRTLLPNARPTSRLSHLSITCKTSFDGFIGNGCRAEALSAFLDYCPALEALSLHGPLETPSGFETVEYLLRGRLQRLTSLVWTSHFPQSDCIGILNSVPPQQLRHVELSQLMDHQFTTLIEKHFQSLEFLDANVLVSTTAEMAGLFTKCQRLRVLKINSTCDFEVRHLIDRPWTICSTLEELSFRFSIQRPCLDDGLTRYAAVEKAHEGVGLMEWQQAERVFMKRLGECVRLQSYSCLFKKGRDSSPEVGTSKGLSWHLSSGLAHLSRLSQLERIDFGERPFVPYKEDLQFMKENWPLLRVIKCSGWERGYETRQWVQDNWPTLIVHVRPKSDPWRSW